MARLQLRSCTRRFSFFTFIAAFALLYFLFLRESNHDGIFFPKTRDEKTTKPKTPSTKSPTTTPTTTTSLTTIPVPNEGKTTKTKLTPLVSFFNVSKETLSVIEFAANQTCVNFAAPGGGTVICVYPIRTDKFVSGSLVTAGMWENDLVFRMEHSLKHNPNMVLLDLGCNIGVFTIYAAKMGRRVVGVDANKMNLALLSRSLDLDKLHKNVKLIWNAVSDVHEKVILRTSPGNVGGRSIQAANVANGNHTTTIQAITLDDLAPLFINTSLFIKMDIESSELKALKSSGVFFKTADVRYVMMEVMWTKKTPTGKAIFAIMTGFGFKPFRIELAFGGFQNALDIETIETWPDNIIWIKPMKIEDIRRIPKEYRKLLGPSGRRFLKDLRKRKLSNL